MAESSGQVGNLKILLALDAFPQDPQTQIKAVAAGRALLKGMAGTVEPIYVARPALPGVFVQVPTGLDAAAAEVAKSHLRKFVREAKLPAVLPPRLIFSTAPSLSSMVKALLEYVQEKKIDLIVVATHARKGFPRFFMGSFAEQLVLHSPQPVLVTRANLDTERTKALKHIVFPTDFSESSHRVFQQALKLAKRLKADLLLFHQIEFIYPEVALPFTATPFPQIDFMAISESRKKEAESWIEEARREGVKAKFHLASKLSDAATGIVSVAKKLPSSVIMMASQSGQWETILLGSVARKVLRMSPCPVYLVHPPREGQPIQSTAKEEAFTRGRAVLR